MKMRTRRALFYATLTCALALITTAYAAPLNEPTASTTTAEGLAANLEISKLGADLSNSIPNDGFVSADGATLQPYASTEVDTIAELAPTSLPMTKEEMALAEVAAVVAELATTTAAELKVKEDGKYAAEDELEAMQQIWRNAEEAKRQVIAHELANTVDTLEGGRLSDEKDFVVATTTLPTTFVETVAATTTTMSPTATTESPQILNELVRAAAAANEILAAALNAANLAATSTNMTDTTAVVANENTIALTVQPALASNTEAGSVDGLIDATASVSDNEELSEAADAITWRPNVGQTEATNIDGEVNGEKTIATATTTATTVERVNADTASDLNVSFAAGGVAEFEKSSEIQTSTQLDVQETTTTVSITKSADEVVNEPTNVEPILWRAGGLLLEHNHSALNKEEMPTSLIGVTSEAAESIEHSTAKELERAESAIAMESLDTTTISGDISAQSTELPKYFEAATPPHSNTVADGEIVGERANIVETANQVAPQATDNDKEFSETQIAEVVEVKQAQMTEDDSQVNETTLSSLDENSNSIPTTTEPLETLIAVESEAQEPNKIISTAWNEPEKEATTSTPEVATTAENFVAPLQPTYADLNRQEAIATTTTRKPDETETANESEYVTNTEISLTTTTTAAAQPETAFTTSTSGDQAEYTTISLAPNQQTTTPSSAQTELPNISEVAAMETVPNTTERSAAEEAFEISLDTQQLPTTTLSAGEQHADTTQFSVGAEETTTSAEATTIPSEVSQTTAAVSHEIRTSSAEQIQETTYWTESKDSSTNVHLAPFTTTPSAMEALQETEVTTRQSELDAYAVVVGSTEIPQSAAVPAPEITNAADTFAATLSSYSTGVTATETTTTLAAIESAGPDLTTPPAAAEREELHTETVEPAVEVKTLEALAEPVADPAATKPVYAQQLNLSSTTTEPQQQQQQQAFSDSESESESESITTPTTARVTAEVESETAATTSIPNQVDITTTTTTSTPEPEIITTTTTSEPETTTTTTTSAPEPDVITTTSTAEPESKTTKTTTTTTTTTLSPMSLIVAEHEARSLDRTPPRVSRVVSEDGVEVLTGYSIVHHIYAAALAAFEAGGA